MANKTIKTTYPTLFTGAQLGTKTKFTNFQLGGTYYIPEKVYVDSDGTIYYKLIKRTISPNRFVADWMLFYGATSNDNGSTGAYVNPS